MVKHAPQTVGRNSNRANTAFMLGLFAILAALAFEHIGGFVPCELCLGERWPYYIGLPLLAIVIGAWQRVPVPWRIAATLVIAAIFVWSTYLGVYHSGVEFGFWPGPTACTGTGGDLSFSDLSNLDAAPRVVPCDQPQIRILGLSFTNMNALVSIVIAGLLVWSAQGQYARLRREKASAGAA